MQEEKKPSLNNFQYLFIFFILYAFLGWIMETMYAAYIHGAFIKRGFLYGPICPIYGYGAILLILVLNKYEKQPIKVFFLSILVFSVFEYIASFALEALFKNHWWDYTQDFMNLNGRISLFYSFVWGIIALLFMKYIQPFVQKQIHKVIDKVPILNQSICINLLTIVFLIDTIFSFIKYLA